MTGFGHLKGNGSCKDDGALLMNLSFSFFLTFQQLSQRGTLSLLTNTLSLINFFFKITCHRIIYSFCSRGEGGWGGVVEITADLNAAKKSLSTRNAQQIWFHSRPLWSHIVT